VFIIHLIDSGLHPVDSRVDSDTTLHLRRETFIAEL